MSVAAALVSSVLVAAVIRVVAALAAVEYMASGCWCLRLRSAFGLR